MMWPLLLVVVIVLLVFLQSSNVVEGKTMWGARRRKDDSDESLSPGKKSDFVYRKSKPEPRVTSSAKPKIVEQVAAKRMAKRQSADLAENFQEIVDQMLSIFDNLLNSPDFDDMVNIDNMQEVLQILPQLEAIPEIKELFDSDELKDPSLLREKLKESFTLAKQYLNEMRDSLFDPSTVSQLLEQLPPEAYTVLNAMKTGDLSSISSVIEELPGISESHKSMISKILSGVNNENSETNEEDLERLVSEMIEEVSESAKDVQMDLLGAMKDQLTDPNVIAQMRAQLLENPSLLQMMGASSDILDDENAFAEFVSQQLAQLQQLQDESTISEAFNGAAEAMLTQRSQKQKQLGDQENIRKKTSSTQQNKDRQRARRAL